MIMIPSNELRKYVSVNEKGMWEHDPNMPEELKPEYEKFLKLWEENQKYLNQFI